jgi:hypothetical protein
MQISLAVLFVHAIILFSSAIDFWFTKRINPKKSILIRTISQVEKKQPLIPSLKNNTHQLNKTASSIKKNKSQPKEKLIEEKKSNSGLKKNNSNSKEIKAREVNEKNKQLLFAELEASFDKLAESSKPKSVDKSIFVPKWDSKKQESSLEEDLKEDFSLFASSKDQIVMMLQQELTLPEIGSVKVALHFDAKGRIEKFQVIESQSEKNSQFLKNRLPELYFPWLNSELSLVVVFSNAM